MSDRVLVPMSREAADELVSGRPRQHCDEGQFRAWLAGRDALSAALDRDREIERLEREAEARGAEAEHARWTARIEKQAAWEDRAKAGRTQLAEMYERNGSTLAKGLRAASYRHHYTGHALRSLLNDSDE